MVADHEGITDTAKRMIAGILDLSDALTAFGNTIPTSYLRLVPKQEAPTRICWCDRNRSVLVRVPLGWLGNTTMINDANPLEPFSREESAGRQTFEFRAPDGSADIHNLLAVSSLHHCTDWSWKIPLDRPNHCMWNRIFIRKKRNMRI